MEYIRIIEINSLQQLELIKLQFNKDDVRYRVLFERTLHLDGMYALGQRGAIIEVWEEHVARASNALEVLGYELDLGEKHKPFPFIVFLEKKTNKIPFFGSLPIPIRLLIIASALFVMSVGIYIYTKTKYRAVDITKKEWCVKKIIHKNKPLEVKTLFKSEFEKSLAETSNNFYGCKERMSFDYTRIRLPGLSSPSAEGRFQLNGDDTITLSQIDQNPKILEGKYVVKNDWLHNRIYLISNHTTIVLRK